jgi:hypothetical protein
MSQLDTNNKWKSIRYFLETMSNATYKITIADDITLNYQNTLTGTSKSALVWDSGQWDVDFWTSENAIQYKEPLPWSIKGKGVYIEFWQTANDPLFKLITIQLIGELIKTIYS